MSFQAYLDSVKTQTGKTPADFAELAAQKGLNKHGEIVAWLKQDFALGHGHATAVAAVLLKSDSRKASPDDKVGRLFAGNKAAWRGAYDALAEKIRGLGSDVELSPNETYVNVLRGNKKFAIVQISSAERLDVGVKLKGKDPEGRLEAAGAWNSMVTHRVRVGKSEEIDTELLGWLEQAYAAAK